MVPAGRHSSSNEFGTGALRSIGVVESCCWLVPVARVDTEEWEKMLAEVVGKAAGPEAAGRAAVPGVADKLAAVGTFAVEAS